MKLDEIRDIYIKIMEEEVKKLYADDNNLLKSRLKFILGRFDEGIGIALYIKSLKNNKNKKLKILDAGCGSVGVMLPLAYQEDFDVYGIEIFMHKEIKKLKEKTKLPFHFVLSDIKNIPYPENFFDWVLLLDTLEHLKEPKIACREIYRVLKPNGFCMITTPCRFKYLLRRDPHFGIFALLLFPNKIQKFFVEKIFKKTKNYDVEKIYFSPFSILKLFPKPARIYFLYNELSPPKSKLKILYNKSLRRYFFDRILIQKSNALNINSICLKVFKKLICPNKATYKEMF